MSTIIRRDPNDRPGKAPARLLLRFLAAVVLAALAAVLVFAWQRGGPRPVREITVPLSAPPAA